MFPFKKIFNAHTKISKHHQNIGSHHYSNTQCLTTLEQKKMLNVQSLSKKCSHKICLAQSNHAALILYNYNLM